jgi:hypothetical protein
MNIKDLYPFIFIVLSIGMLLGIGIVVLDTFGDAVKRDATIYNETVAIATQTGSTANDEVSAVSYFGNSTINCIPPDPICVNVSEDGVITTNSSFSDGSYDITYTYDEDTTGTTAMASAVSAVAPIASTWLPLIVTVFILAIILGLVIKSFTGGRR